MSDIQKSQTPFLDAARDVIKARLPGITTDDSIIAKVSKIVQEALKRQEMTDVRQILRIYPKWLDESTKDLAQAHLLETTSVDDIEEIDVDAYRV